MATFYIAAVTAHKPARNQGQLSFRKVVASIVAQSYKDALARAQQVEEEECPESEGWIRHPIALVTFTTEELEERAGEGEYLVTEIDSYVM